MARLILDTGVLVAGARGRLDVAGLDEDDDVALPAVVGPSTWPGCCLMRIRLGAPPSVLSCAMCWR